MKVNEWRRKFIQVITAVLYNCHFTGFAKGNIYKGKTKALCVPGLNCYSCPGATFSCPLGSLQAALVSSKYKFPYYMLGVMLLLGILFGRLVCGFLCPFGLIQELLHKIPTPKIKKGKWSRIASYLKYVILVIFVILIPITCAVPGFCKYICPAGSLEGGLLLVLKNPSLRSMIGFLFSWKMAVLLVILLASIFIYRFFCRFLCPLGAFYSLFNRVSFFRMQVDESKCNHCEACVKQCPMDVKKVGDHECIQCGACKSHCSQGAICRFASGRKKQNVERKHI